MRRRLVTIGIENPSLGLQAEACGVLQCAVSLVAAGLNQPHPVSLDDLWRLALRMEKCRQDWQDGWAQSWAPQPQGS